MSDRLSGLSREKRALLEKRLRRRLAEREPEEHVERRPPAQPVDVLAETLMDRVERRARSLPACVAARGDGVELTYADLVDRAGALAARLRRLELPDEAPVGVAVDGGVDLPVAVLGVLAAGSPCVPLAAESTAGELPLAALVGDGAPSGPGTDGLPVVAVAAQGGGGGAVSAVSLAASRLALIEPPSRGGTMLTHGGLLALVEAVVESGGIGPRVPVADAAGSTLVLMLAALTAGRCVDLQRDGSAAGRRRPSSAGPGMDFSLFYFSTDAARSAVREGFQLLLEGVGFADRHGFRAAWTPERHFHPFGGLFPNPSVTNAALAASTERIELRAGSVVLPLHHPVRVAEDWSFIDNLSGGRVGVAFASGWHANDFVLAPDSYGERRELMFRGIETVRRLWRGEAVSHRDGAGKEIEVTIFPKPLQAELPVWITAAGNPETFERAGAIGANLLTHLLGQSVEQVGERIDSYRRARGGNGHDPEAGTVSLMLHTFVGRDLERVRETVRDPFCEYIRSFTGLLDNLARSMDLDVSSDSFSEDDVESLLSFAFERYFSTSALFGTPGRCLEMIDRLHAVGVDEVACLIDFGVEPRTVLEALEPLDEVRRRVQAQSGPRRAAAAAPPAAALVESLLDAGPGKGGKVRAPLPLRVAGAAPGEVGELCCADHLLRGYWGDSRRTAERLVPDPLASAPGGRLLRTGRAAVESPGGGLRVLPSGSADGLS